MTPDELPQPFRPLPIRAMNAVGRGLAHLGSRPISLAPESLMRAAEKIAGSSDYGPETFRPGFLRVVQSLEEDARLTLFGRYFARRQVVELLVNRLRLVDYRNRHPEVAQERIERPIFVLGLPRTGTTLLYGLLAEDPAHRAPMSWEIDTPCPPAQAETYLTDDRIEYTRKRFDQLQLLAPGFQAIHPIGTQMPQECIVLTASEFLSVRFEMCFDVAGYQRWLPEQDMRPAYRFHREFLQHMQSRHRLDRWVLKSPGHLGPIDALLETYPDALLIQTHRDPIRVLPSVSSLEYTMRMVATDEQDPAELGRQQLFTWGSLLDQGMALRDRHPDWDERILDLHYHEIAADPMGCIERVYDRFGLALGDAARERMQAYIAAHPKNEYGSHRYSPEAFGLQAEAIQERFKAYNERFGVAPEPY